MSQGSGSGDKGGARHRFTMSSLRGIQQVIQSLSLAYDLIVLTVP